MATTDIRIRHWYVTLPSGSDTDTLSLEALSVSTLLGGGLKIPTKIQHGC